MAGHINLNQVLARSPEEAARMNDLYPANDFMTTAGKIGQQAPMPLAHEQSGQQLVQPHAVAQIFDSSPQSMFHSHSCHTDIHKIKQSSDKGQTTACPFKLAQAQDAGKAYCSLQDSGEKASCIPMASLEEIKEMVTAAEQQAMPVVKEEALDRRKRARFEGTYKEPTGGKDF